MKNGQRYTNNVTRLHATRYTLHDYTKKMEAHYGKEFVYLTSSIFNDLFRLEDIE